MRDRKQVLFRLPIGGFDLQVGSFGLMNHANFKVGCQRQSIPFREISVDDAVGHLERTNGVGVGCYLVVPDFPDVNAYRREQALLRKIEVMRSVAGMMTLDEPCILELDCKTKRQSIIELLF